MVYFDSTDIYKRTNVNETGASKKCDICHYWYLLNYSFKFKTNICNRCHGLLMMSVNLSDIAVLNIEGSDYCCIFNGISRSKTIKFLQNTDLTEKMRTP